MSESVCTPTEKPKKRRTPSNKPRRIIRRGSVLPTQLIRKYCQEKNMVEPFAERTVYKGKTYGIGPCSYDLRIKQHIVLLPHRKYGLWKFLKLLDKIYSWFNCRPFFSHYHCGFALVSSIEKVNMPDDVCAMVMDKSSWARRGLAVQNTHFDPGFCGYPTLELSNEGTSTIEIPAGVAICQLKFELLYEPTEMPYRGKYQNQPDKPVEAIEGKDTWA